MKNINLQYRELLEGKMNQAQFLRNARMMFPNFVTNQNSFNDSVTILKTKGMITEGDAVKGTPDKAPTYDYPTQPGKYKTVEQSPEVDEQDGVYPATTLTDIPKEKVSKPTKSKTRPDGLEPIKNNDTKNEMKKVKVVKEGVHDPARGAAKKDITSYSNQQRKLDNASRKGYHNNIPTDNNIVGPSHVFDKDSSRLNKSLKKDYPDLKENGTVDIEKAIRDKKIDPAKIKAAAEKAMRGDSTELAALMAFGGKVNPVREDYNSYDEPPHDRPRHKGWDWESDADYEDEDNEEKDLDENNKSFDKIFADFIESDDTTELRTYIKENGKEAIAKIKSKLPGLYDKARQKVAKLLKVELDEIRMTTEAKTQLPADTLAVTTLLNRVPMLPPKLNLINNAGELQDVFDYILDRVNPSLESSPTQLRTALNLAIQSNIDDKKAKKQAGTPPVPSSNNIKDKLKPAITKLVQEVLDEMGPQ